MRLTENTKVSTKYKNCLRGLVLLGSNETKMYSNWIVNVRVVRAVPFDTLPRQKWHGTFLVCVVEYLLC